MKENMTEALKKIIPVAIDSIAEYMSNKKEESNVPVEVNVNTIKNISDETFPDKVNKLAVGFIKYAPVTIPEMNRDMDEMGYNTEKKIESAYLDGFINGFRLAHSAHVENTISAIYGALNDDKVFKRAVNIAEDAFGTNELEKEFYDKNE